MTEKMELRGRWWLPDSEEHQVFGTLAWSPQDGGTLHLHDELRPVVLLDNVLADGSIQKYRADGAQFQRSYPVIFGRVGNRAYTLLDSFRLTAREYDVDVRAEEVHVDRFLDGAWFDDAQDLRVDRVVIDLRHLTCWVEHSGLEVNWSGPKDGPKDIFAVITAKKLPAFVTTQNEMTLSLTQGLRSTGDHLHELGVAQRWSLRLQQSAPALVNTFIDVASDFQDLVSIAVGNTATFDKVVLYHPDVPLLSVGGKPIENRRDNITYHALWTNRVPACDPVMRHQIYFSFDDFGGIDGVGRWLKTAANYRTELGRVIATRYYSKMFVEDRIMNVSAALDSFDKHRQRTGKWVKYAKRVEHCVDLAGQPFLNLIVIDAGQWVDRAVTIRDDLAHHRDQFRAHGTVGDQLLSEQLFWLFTFCMFRLSDAPDAVYKQVNHHPQVRWLIEQASVSQSEPT